MLAMFAHMLQNFKCKFSLIPIRSEACFFKTKSCSRCRWGRRNFHFLSLSTLVTISVKIVSNTTFMLVILISYRMSRRVVFFPGNSFASKKWFDLGLLQGTYIFSTLILFISPRILTQFVKLRIHLKFITTCNRWTNSYLNSTSRENSSISSSALKISGKLFHRGVTAKSRVDLLIWQLSFILFFFLPFFIIFHTMVNPTKKQNRICTSPNRLTASWHVEAECTPIKCARHGLNFAISFISITPGLNSFILVHYIRSFVIRL